MSDMDDGFENENNFGDEDEKDEQTLALESEFEKLVEKAHAKIEEEIAEARKHLNKAVALSEKYGVPFRANISPLSNSYVPDSFSTSKFAELDLDTVCDISGVWGEWISELLSGSGGWLHSAVC